MTHVSKWIAHEVCECKGIALESNVRKDLYVRIACENKSVNKNHL